MAAATYFDQVQKLYIAYFGRPADPTGLNYWASQVDAAGGNMAVAIAGFAVSAESTNLFGSLPSAQKISAIYMNLFNRPPESAGLSYWISQIDSGAVTQAQAAWQIMNQAGAGDSTSVANKLAMANAFTAQIDTAAEIAGYNGSQSATYGRAYLAGVDATAGSVSSATSNLVGSVATATGVTSAPSTAPSVPATPQTFTLTAGTDTFTGGASNDIFNGDQTAFTAVDTLDGGAGKDTLNLTDSGTAGWTLPAATVKNIEIINVHNFNSPPAVDIVNAANFIGATNFNADRSSSAINFNNLIAGQQIGIIGDSSVIGAGVNARYDNSVTSATLNFSGGTVGTASVTLNGGALSALTITSSGAANVAGSVEVISSGVTNATINADTNLTLGGIIGFKTAVASNTLTVTGAASTVTLGTLSNTIGTVDASGLTMGGIVATLSTNTAVNFTGGGGNDVVTSSGVPLTGVVDAGAGIDRLILTGTVGAPAAAQYTGFEELQVTNATQDVSLLTGSTITKLVMSGTSGVTGISATQAANIQALAGGTYTIGVTGASNTVHITADDGATTTPTITLSNLNVTGAGTLQLTAVDNVSVSSLTGANGLSSVKLDGAGTIGVTTGAVTFAVGSSIDASTATGAVTFNASAALVNGLTIKGGSGNDILTGTAFDDVIAGGAGVNTLTGGGGANTFQFTAGGADFVAIGVANLINSKTVITDWSTGSGNKIDFGATTLAAVAHTASAIPGRASVNAAGLANIQISDSTLESSLTALSNAMGSDPAGTSAVFFYPGSSYLFVSNGIAGIQAGDALIQLTGINAQGLTFSGGDITGILL